jgi:hypothetical protein
LNVLPPPLLDAQGKEIKKPEVKIPAETSKLVGPDGERVYSLAEVEKLLAGKGAVAAGGVITSGAVVPTKSSDSNTLLTAIAGLLTSGGSGVKDLMTDLLNLDDVPLNAKGEKCLLPTSFLSCVRGTQNTDEVVHSGKGQNLILQSTLNRVTKPEKLTVGQWTAANARILAKLISDNRLTASELQDYLEYNRKLGDLLQIFTPGSCFMLDNNHRLEVHDKADKRWCAIDSTLEIAHLKRRDDGATGSIGGL